MRQNIFHQMMGIKLEYKIIEWKEVCDERSEV